jgi:hypothetical protein
VHPAQCQRHKKRGSEKPKRILTNEYQGPKPENGQENKGFREPGRRNEFAKTRSRLIQA